MKNSFPDHVVSKSEPVVMPHRNKIKKRYRPDSLNRAVSSRIVKSL